MGEKKRRQMGNNSRNAKSKDIHEVRGLSVFAEERKIPTEKKERERD